MGTGEPTAPGARVNIDRLMSRRIIFLDVDGVLNNASWREQQDYAPPPGTPREHRGMQWIDPSAVERLNLLVERSGAEVVLASSWRARGLEQVQELLALRGFRGQLHDRTPLPEERDPVVFRRLAGRDPPPGCVWPRGYEIQQWLDDQFDVDAIVILDDAASLEHLDPWLVRTSLREGLCDHHVIDALGILAKPGPKPRASVVRGSDARAWELRASELIDLVTAKLARVGGDRPLFGVDTEVWSTERWQAYLAALDRWWRWAQLGRDADAEGRYKEANACLSAALWLQPESADNVFGRTLRHRPKQLAPQLLRRFDPEFPGLAFRARHERAWALGRNLAGLPTLVRWSCDPRPWIRMQIYRSLARLAHPAGIQVLQEGSFDPHPRARAAAVRGLGRCLDPTAFGRLRRLARSEQDPEVRAAALEAQQLVATYWSRFGDWGELVAAPSQVRALALELGGRGAREAALALLDRFTTDDDDVLAVREELGDSRERARVRANYEPPPALAPHDDGAGYPDPVQAHADLRASGARGFEARRGFRFLGIGVTKARRAHAPAHVD